MEIITQPSTIGEMTPEHFEKFVSGIVEHVVREVTNPRFDAIEASIARLELRMDRIEKRVDLIEDDLVEIKTTLNGYGPRFYMIESYLMYRDYNIQKQPA